MPKERFLIVVAGGKGTRMQASCPKQFLRLEGKTVLQMTIERFLEAVPGIRVIVVLPKEHVETWKEICYEDNFICPQILIAGGITRYHSVKNALARLPQGALAAVHDGVRPLLSKELIRRLFELAEQKGSAVPVLPCTDTIKVLGAPDADGIRLPLDGSKADRSVLFGAQTPQIFSSEILHRAYAQPFDTSFTDDASVVESAGFTVCYAEGERNNIKLTTPEDLALARAIISLGC